MNIVVAPGQGSQTPGFLTPWITEVEGFRELLEHYSEVVGLDLVRLGSDADEDTIKDTAIAQPLIVAAGLAAYRTMPDQSVTGVAGHSVGEFTAAAISGVLRDEDALRLVSVRAKAMAEAASKTSTSMAAVLGGEMEQISSRLSELGLFGANYNGAGQLVAAGPKDAILELVGNPPEKSRVIELKVAGAFHTPFMEDARQVLERFGSELIPADPKLKLWSNEAGQLVSSGKEFLRLLIHQVANPVRWDLVMGNFAGQDVQFLELPPAGALSGLLKRAVQDCRTVPLRTPQDFEKVSQ
jgi:[acyl-carrier-protein] S-malonyltransferase